ncbi:MAG: hypothetical protein IIC67_02050 [Thaumarchaeota archaeon]|nr:hypothetical protein [Nitrososphaerota archaeon]
MSYKENITEMSARIDMYLEKERQTGEFVSERLYEYVREVLYESYQISRNKMEVELGEGIVEIGLVIAGKLLSSDEMIDYTTKLGDARLSSQRDLDKKWRLVPETMRNKKTDELFNILETNRQEGFKKTLASLEII